MLKFIEKYNDVALKNDVLLSWNEAYEARESIEELIGDMNADIISKDSLKELEGIKKSIERIVHNLNEYITEDN